MSIGPFLTLDFWSVLAGAPIILILRRPYQALVPKHAAFALVALLSAAAVLLLLESAVIMSLYVPNYHNYLAFYAAFLCLSAGQIAVNGVGRLAGIGLEHA